MDLSDCNLSAIPSGSDCNLSAIPSGIHRNYSETTLYLSGNDFISLPESSLSQFSYLKLLYLDGCKSLRSLSNIQIPFGVSFICVDNCTSLEGLPEAPSPYLCGPSAYFTVQCFNCFKLAENFQNVCNMFQVSLSLISVCVF